MPKRLHGFHHVFQPACTLLTLIVDALRYLELCLHPSSALSAENLFLRKQLALFQDVSLGPRIPLPPASLPVPRQAHRPRLLEHLRVRARPIAACTTTTSWRR
jgi:hypothetical protein